MIIAIKAVILPTFGVQVKKKWLGVRDKRAELEEIFGFRNLGVQGLGCIGIIGFRDSGLGI